MAEIYISWCEGLPYSKEALKIIRDSELVAGIELSNIDDQPQRIHDEGVKYSLHNPTRWYKRDLMDPRFMEVFYGKLELYKKGEDLHLRSAEAYSNHPLLRYIWGSDNPSIGFHLGPSLSTYYPRGSEKNSFLPVSAPGVRIWSNWNIKWLDEVINENPYVQAWWMTDEIKKLGHFIEKKVLFEGLPLYHEDALQSMLGMRYRRDEISWWIQNMKTDPLKERIIELGKISAFRDLLNINLDKKKRIGFLLDIAHNLITANTLIQTGEYVGSREHYFDELLTEIGDNVYEAHVSVPMGDLKSGLIDHHPNLLEKDDCISDLVIALTRETVRRCRNLKVLAIEIMPGFKPVEHVKTLLGQAEYLLEEIPELSVYRTSSVLD